MSDSASDILEGTGDAPVTPDTPDTPAVQTPEWMGDLDTDLAGYVANKGWKTPVDVLKSYQGVEKMVGGQVKIPETGDEEGWNNFYGKLGRPETPDAYDLGEPNEAVPEDVAAWYKGVAHEMGVPQDKVVAGYAKLAEFLESQGEASIQAQEARNETQMTELRKEWGSGYDGEISVAKKAAAAFGFTADQIDEMAGAIGTGEVLKRFAAMGHKIGEHGADGEDSLDPGFGMTPERAKARRQQLMDNPQFLARYQSGDQDAVEEISKLMAIMG